MNEEIMAIIDQSVDKAKAEVRKEILDDIAKDWVQNPVSFRAEGLTDRIAQATKFCIVAFKLLIHGETSITFHPKQYEPSEVLKTSK